MSTHDHDGRTPDDRDAKLRTHWRSVSDEQPSSRIDAAIIDAARKSVVDPRETVVRPRSARWLSPWQSLAAAAGVAGLAFVLVPMLPRHPAPTPTLEQREAPTAAAPAELPSASGYESAKSRSAPASAPVAAESREEQGAPAPTGKLPDSLAGSRSRAAEQAIPVPPGAAGTSTEDLAGGAPTDAAPEDAPEDLAGGATTDAAPAAASKAAPAPAQVFESTDAGHRETARRQASDRAATGGLSAPSAARESSFGAALATDPAAWAARIASLHASGDLAGAEQELRAFREAWPDADERLPDALRDWARTIK